VKTSQVHATTVRPTYGETVNVAPLVAITTKLFYLILSLLFFREASKAGGQTASIPTHCSPLLQI